MRDKKKEKKKRKEEREEKKKKAASFTHVDNICILGALGPAGNEHGGLGSSDAQLFSSMGGDSRSMGRLFSFHSHNFSTVYC